MSLKEANDSIGLLLAVAGLIGIAPRPSSPTGCGSTPGVPTCSCPPRSSCSRSRWESSAILNPARIPSLSFLFVASILMAMVLGPSNTVTANVVPANRRAAGYALFIFLIHLLGDISSPILLGGISDLFGSSAVVNSSLGHFLPSIGAGPTADENGQMTNLTVAMLAVGPVLLLGSVLFLSRLADLPGDKDRVAADGHAEESRRVPSLI